MPPPRPGVTPRPSLPRCAAGHSGARRRPTARPLDGDDRQRVAKPHKEHQPQPRIRRHSRRSSHLPSRQATSLNRQRFETIDGESYTSFVTALSDPEVFAGDVPSLLLNGVFELTLAPQCPLARHWPPLRQVRRDGLHRHTGRESVVRQYSHDVPPPATRPSHLVTVGGYQVTDVFDDHRLILFHGGPRRRSG